MARIRVAVTANDYAPGSLFAYAIISMEGTTRGVIKNMQVTELDVPDKIASLEVTHPLLGRKNITINPENPKGILVRWLE